jgi:hypothetical protein
MSPETAVRETLPALNVAVERSLKLYRKEAFFEEAQNCKRGFD